MFPLFDTSYLTTPDSAKRKALLSIFASRLWHWLRLDSQAQSPPVAAVYFRSAKKLVQQIVHTHEHASARACILVTAPGRKKNLAVRRSMTI